MSKQERVPAHLHCSICGKSIPPNRDFCSPECREKSMKSRARNKMISRIYTVILVLIFVSLIIFTLFSGS